MNQIPPDIIPGTVPPSERPGRDDPSPPRKPYDPGDPADPDQPNTPGPEIREPQQSPPMTLR